jgi:hypothetical protein
MIHFCAHTRTKHTYNTVRKQLHLIVIASRSFCNTLLVLLIDLYLEDSSSWASLSLTFLVSGSYNFTHVRDVGL